MKTRWSRVLFSRMRRSMSSPSHPTVQSKCCCCIGAPLRASTSETATTNLSHSSMSPSGVRRQFSTRHHGPRRSSLMIQSVGSSLGTRMRFSGRTDSGLRKYATQIRSFASSGLRTTEVVPFRSGRKTRRDTRTRSPTVNTEGSSLPLIAHAKRRHSHMFKIRK